MAINILWLQRLWPVLRNSGPLISRLADAYVKRGADQKSAETMAEMAVLLDQILDERLQPLPRREDLEALRQELAALRGQLSSAVGGRQRNPYLLLLLVGQVVIFILLMVILVRL
ncbi:MAG: hypothetical protein ACYCZC_04300 [Acidithiobacillus sp.]